MYAQSKTMPGIDSELNVKVIPATPALKNDQSQAIVFLHGWGNDLRSWQALIECLDGSRDLVLVDLPGFGGSAQCVLQDQDAAIQEIYRSIPKPCHLIGWSLGGMLAAKMAHAYPQDICSLTTIASNAKFVADDEWQAACSANVFIEFVGAFEEDLSACVKRFTFLQVQGDKKRKELQKYFRSINPLPALNQENGVLIEKQAWRTALHWLSEIDNRKILPNLQQRHLAIFGECDALVPIEVAEEFKFSHMANSVLEVSSSGHAPHVSQNRDVASAIEAFLTSVETPYARDKQALAQSFSRASENYDRLARLQSEVAKSLCEKHKNYRGDICDLGCGTGFVTNEIINADCNIIGLDIAQGMLAQSRQKMLEGNAQFLCADFESLPFAEESFDGAVSSMSFQWANRLETLLTEVRRALKPGGWLLFSTLGPKTLHELKRSWQAVDQYVHVNQFDAKVDVCNALVNSGFEIEDFSEEEKTLHYSDVFQLMRELKGIGAHNINAGKKNGVTTKSQLQSLAQSYESFRDPKGLPASYQVFYVLAKLRT